MAFIVIAGITVPVEEGQAVRRVERIGVEARAYAGNLLSAVRAEKRQWAVTTAFLTQAQCTALEAAVALAAHVTCSGDALGGSVNCSVEVGDGAYINVATTDGLGFLRALALTIREV